MIPLSFKITKIPLINCVKIGLTFSDIHLFCSLKVKKCLDIAALSKKKNKELKINIVLGSKETRIARTGQKRLDRTKKEREGLNPRFTEERCRPS